MYAKHDTLTARNLVDSYISAYDAVYGQKPNCQHEEGKFFLVNGLRRDRQWMVIEIERLRQEGLQKMLDTNNPSSKGHVFKMIRRLARL
jgi:hypothetical protein